MGNFEKLSVLVIVVIILMILVVALYTWTDNPDGSSGADKSVAMADEQPKVLPAILPGQGRTKQEKGPLVIDPVKVPPPAPLFPDLTGKIIPFPEPAPMPAPILPDPAKVAAEPKTHVVASGETIGKIAGVYFPGRVQKGTDAILKANPAVEPSRMRPGLKLMIPDLAGAVSSTDGKLGIVSGKSERAPEGTSGVTKGSTYVVRKGDTLPVLSKRAYGEQGRWQDIWLENFNAIDDPDHLLPGTRLKIPR